MRVIDGSLMEGGGQVVRVTTALSALTGEPCEITGIRAGREKPGLRPQHMAAIRAVAGVCDARIEGCGLGSSRLRFFPGPLRVRDVTVDIGTAGSITLVLQSWLPAALRAGGSITLTGGTEVPRSPTIDYFLKVMVPVLVRHGADIRVGIIDRGYLPQGRGMVRVAVEASRLVPLSIGGGRDVEGRGIVSCSAGLPPHVTERQAHAAAAVLLHETGLEYPVFIDRREGPGTGSSCTVWDGWKGACALGRPGLPAEKVGRAAAREQLVEMEGEWEVDQYLADQLLVYLALCGGKYTARLCTMHARTICALLAQFGYVIRVREDEVVEFSYEAGS